MTEYTSAVERQKILIEAEKWAKEINQIHCHSLTSMYYDTVETKEVFAPGYGLNPLILL